MKKIICALALGAMTFASSIAQNAKTTSPPETHQFTLGTRVGINESSYWGDAGLLTPKFKLGFQGGLYARWMFKNQIGLEIGADFTRMGSSFGNITFTDTTGTPIGTARMNTRLDYVQIPLICYFNLNTISPKFKFLNEFLLGVGPVAGILVSSGTSIPVNPNTNPAPNTFDMGLQVNLKPVIQVKSLSIEPEIGYYLGLTKNYSQTTTSNFRNQSMYFRCSFGYRI